MEIRLKRVTQDDLERIMYWRMKPSVTKYMNTDPILDMEKQKEWYSKISRSDEMYYWIIWVDGVPIGLIGIIDIDRANRRCSWIWYIGEDEYRGKGIAKKIQLNLYDYVFETLGLNRLFSHILSYNEHEINNVHLACGYEVEGIMKQHVYKNGQYLDVVIMGITADRWREIKPSYEYPKIQFE
jgi:UDP-4-amino-4,6-dideoxy-N-acetyl-beta-L-altrosamine N-acetyltransferase